MNDLEEKMREAERYKKGSDSAFAVADARRDGKEGVTELISSGDAPYLILIAVNIITEAARNMNISEERLNRLIREIRADLLEDHILSKAGSWEL